MSDLQTLATTIKAAMEVDPLFFEKLAAEIAGKVPQQSEIMTVEEVMAVLKVSRTTLWRMRTQPNFPSEVRMSERKFGFRRSEIEEWIVKRSA